MYIYIYIYIKNSASRSNHSEVSARKPIKCKKFDLETEGQSLNVRLCRNSMAYHHVDCVCKINFYQRYRTNNDSKL